MKSIALITTFLFSFTALADAGSRIAFERSLEEYQYALTSEWDQKDAVALEKINSAFKADVKSLVDLSDEDVIAVLEKKAISKTHLDTLELRISLARNSGDPEAEFDALKEELKRSFSQGASWNGETTQVLVAAALLFGGLIAFAIVSTDPGECLEMAEYIDCDNSGNDCRPVTRCKTYSR